MASTSLSEEWSPGLEAGEPQEQARVGGSMGVGPPRRSLWLGSAPVVPPG